MVLCTLLNEILHVSLLPILSLAQVQVLLSILLSFRVLFYKFFDV